MRGLAARFGLLGGLLGLAGCFAPLFPSLLPRFLAAFSFPFGFALLFLSLLARLFAAFGFAPLFLSLLTRLFAAFSFTFGFAPVVLPLLLPLLPLCFAQSFTPFIRAGAVSLVRPRFFPALPAGCGEARFGLPVVSFGFALLLAARLSGGFAAGVGLFDAALGLQLGLPPRLASG